MAWASKSVNYIFGNYGLFCLLDIFMGYHEDWCALVRAFALIRTNTVLEEDKLLDSLNDT